MPLDTPMRQVLKQKLTKTVQQVFWIYLNNNFLISGINDFKTLEPRIKCTFIPITLDNYHRVVDFREGNRISEYKDKLLNKEIGYFTKHNQHMIGSIWATINTTDVPHVVRTYMRLMPNEGLIHDIVSGTKWRGMGVGPFMVSGMAAVLLKEYGLSRIIIDVNIRNRASLRMMDRLGLRIHNKTLNVSAFGRLLLQLGL
jgi:hypothetical protein